MYVVVVICLLTLILNKNPAMHLYNFGSFFYALNVYTRMPKISKSRKSQKTTKRRRNKSTKRRMRGGCGCNTAVPAAIMQGGDSCGAMKMSGGDSCGAIKMSGGDSCGAIKMSGGNGLDGVPKEAYYPFSNDNRLLDANLSSRIIGGGRRTKRGGKGKKHRKMSGGSAFLSQLGESVLLRTVGTASSAVTALPIANVPNAYSPPLV
jgi:hypothetical protein